MPIFLGDALNDFALANAVLRAVPCGHSRKSFHRRAIVNGASVSAIRLLSLSQKIGTYKKRLFYLVYSETFFHCFFELLPAVVREERHTPNYKFIIWRFKMDFGIVVN